MNFSASLATKSGAPYAGTAGNTYSGGNGAIDYFQRDIAPSPLALVRENLGTAYACSSLNADLVAKTRLRLYVKTRKGEGQSRLKRAGKTKALSDAQWGRLQKNQANTVSDSSDLEEVTDHPALNLLERPNPRNSQNDGTGMSLFTLLEASQLYQETVGRVYWYCGERTETRLGGQSVGSVPSQIWLLAPQYVTEWPGFGEDAPIIEKYQFALGTGRLADYAPADVVPFRMTDMATGGYSGGMSPLRACFEYTRLRRFTDGMTSARVQNGGRPDALFIPSADEMGGSMGRDESARLEQILRSRYRMAGAGSIIVADIPGTLEPITWPINDVINAARFGLLKEDIAECYHVPMTKLRRDSSTRASADSGDYAHALDAGLPRLRRNEAALNTFFTPMYGEEAAERLFFAFDDPPGLVDDTVVQARYALAVNRGAITINQQLRDIGADEIGPEGDKHLVPSTVVALNPDGTPMKAPPAAGGNDEDGKPNEKVPDPSGAVDEHGKPVMVKPSTAPIKPEEPKDEAIAKALTALADALKGERRGLPAIHIHNAMPSFKTEGPHDYSCLMAQIPKPHADDLLAFGKTIPDADLADDGRENDPHVTVKYGLHGNDPDEVADLMKSEKPIALTIGACKVFPANEQRDSDVIVFDVDSPDLHRLNAKVSAAMSHTDTYPKYDPHLTVAYVKPGTGQRYATIGNATSGLVGRKLAIDKLLFSDKSNRTTDVPIGKRFKVIPTTIAPDDSGKPPVPPEFAPPQEPAPHLENALRKVFREQREAVLSVIDALPDDEIGKWFKGENGNGHHEG